MEWTPDLQSLAPATQINDALTERQEQIVRHVFDVFKSSDSASTSTLSYDELTELLTALDINVKQDAPNLQQLMTNFPGGMSYNVLRDMIRDHAFYRVQSGRHFVTLTLREAESLRAAIHAARLGGEFMQQAIFGGSDTAVALRTGYRILDETVQFERPEEYQERMI